MHVVFFNSKKFSSFEEALKGTLRTDLVVMAVLFEVKFIVDSTKITISLSFLIVK